MTAAGSLCQEGGGSGLWPPCPTSEAEHDIGGVCVRRRGKRVVGFPARRVASMPETIPASCPPHSLHTPLRFTVPQGTTPAHKLFGNDDKIPTNERREEQRGKGGRR